MLHLVFVDEDGIVAPIWLVDGWVVKPMCSDIKQVGLISNHSNSRKERGTQYLSFALLSPTIIAKQFKTESSNVAKTFMLTILSTFSIIIIEL